jgi:hypothetical protein
MSFIPKNKSTFPLELSRFFGYVQRFDVVPIVSSDSRLLQAPDPVTNMYILKRATRSDGTRLGDVIPLTQIQAFVQLLPRFGEKADTRLTKENSMEYCSEFFLNKYLEKDVYYFFESTE